MRVLVVGSCGKRKFLDDLEQPSCHDIDGEKDINYWKQRFSTKHASARDMYTGHQHKELVKAVDLLRSIPGIEVQLIIISAGFGMLQEEDLIPPYDCSFSTMRIAQVLERAKMLQIREEFINLLENDFDLIYLALGKRYLAALGVDDLSMLKTPTVLFHGHDSTHLIRIPCAAETVKSFSKNGHEIHGVVGFKGDLLRVLAQNALDRRNPRNAVENWAKPAYLRKLILRLGGLDTPI